MAINTPWLLKTTSGEFATSGDLQTVSSNVSNISATISSVSSSASSAYAFATAHSGTLTISSNGETILDKWDGTITSGISIVIPEAQSITIQGENGISATSSNNTWTIGLSAEKSEISAGNGINISSNSDNTIISLNVSAGDGIGFHIDDSSKLVTISATNQSGTGGLTAVTTDETLTGNGTSNNALGVNLTNALELTGAGSVTLTASAGKLVISGAEAKVPDNVMLSANNMQTGQWIWNDGQFIQGTSYYANYKTYSTTLNADIEVPLSGIYFNCHNNSSATTYNYITTYAYNNTGGIQSGTLYTMPSHWTSMLSGKDGIVVTPTNSSWNVSINDSILSKTYLPLSGGTVTKLEADGAEVLQVSGDNYNIFKVTRTNHGAGIFGVISGGGAFIKYENTNADNNAQLGITSSGIELQLKNGNEKYKVPSYSGLDTSATYVLSGNGKFEKSKAVEYVENDKKTPFRICVVSGDDELVQKVVEGYAGDGALFFVCSAINN